MADLDRTARSTRCEPFCLHEFGADSCDAFGARCIVLLEEARETKGCHRCGSEKNLFRSPFGWACLFEDGCATRRGTKKRSRIRATGVAWSLSSREKK
jgi:hypothetical protein